MLRNAYPTVGKYEIPMMRGFYEDVSDIKLISADHIRTNASAKDLEKSVHFFLDDNKFEQFYTNPNHYLIRLAQYAHVLTPDFSLYTDMPLSLQIYNTFRNRWCGAHWQFYNLLVIPTVSWSTPESFEFCFDGIEKNSVVALSTVGLKKKEREFMEGYLEMKSRIKPKQVICLGELFPGMGGEVVHIDYSQTIGRRK